MRFSGTPLRAVSWRGADLRSAQFEPGEGRVLVDGGRGTSGRSGVRAPGGGGSFVRWSRPSGGEHRLDRDGRHSDVADANDVVGDHGNDRPRCPAGAAGADPDVSRHRVAARVRPLC